MFRLTHENDVKKAFRPKDAHLVELPLDLTFPCVVTDYLAWTPPSGGRVFMLFSLAKGQPPTGIVFDVESSAAAGMPSMCDLCHCVGAGNQVGLLTARLNSHKRVGLHACKDLSCKQKLEEEANRLGHSALPKIEKMLRRLAQFAQEGLRIDLQGLGRP